MDVDWTVLGLGALALVVALATIAVVAAVTQHWAADRVARPSRLVTAAGNAGLGPQIVVGTRLALEPGRGAAAVPVRSVMAGTSLAIGALVGALCFAASLDALVDTPRLYGWDWDVSLLDTSGYGGIDTDQASLLFDDDPRVDGWAGVYFGSDNLDGRNVPLIGTEPDAAVVPPIISGRTIADANEIVVGPATIAALGKRIGDELELGGDGSPTTVEIVGTAIFPTIGQVHGNHPSLGVGAMVAPELVPGALTDGFGPSAVFLRYAAGTDHDAARAWLREETEGIGEFPGSTEILDALRPAEIVNSQDISAAPALMATALGLAALAALALALSLATLRRRRDLALLKALGFTRRQISMTVSWQATLTVVIGLLVGVPLGIAVGQWLWRLFARELYVVSAPIIPMVALSVLTVAVLVLSNLAAAGSGRAASRIPAAEALRVE